MARLSVKTVEQAKPKPARYETPDAQCPGLFLVVQPSGAKSWALRFRSPVERDEKGQRKAKKLTLGTVALTGSGGQPVIGYPLTVGQARMLATVALEDVRRGIDPTHVRRQEKAAARVEAMADNTVDAAMVEFLKRYKGRKKQGLRESTRLLTAHYLGLKPNPDVAGEWKMNGGGVLRRWAGRSLSSITKHDAIVLLDGIADSGRGVTANRTLTNLKTFFAWCIQRDMLVVSPVAVLDAPADEVSRDRTLSDAEIRALWSVAGREGYPFGKLIQLLVLTGARRDELREASWAEFDLKERTWLLPAERSKNGREHLVPLSSGAIAILEKLPRIAKSNLLFTTTGETPISGLSKVKARLESAMLEALREANSNAQIEPWTPHDLRRTFYSGLQRLGFSIEVAEACVNHTAGTLRGVAKVYGRHKYLAEKTAAFEAWGRHVAGLVSGHADNNVVEFQTVKA